MIFGNMIYGIKVHNVEMNLWSKNKIGIDTGGEPKEVSIFGGHIDCWGSHIGKIKGPYNLNNIDELLCLIVNCLWDRII